eukprot:GHVU01047163.1.p2 GENE.GHVU01047163.1~~GHVU01047163.1.p2  ORF type:complete len:213 (-),score=28.81 GHVU01047163.1:592-1230(-)
MHLCVREQAKLLEGLKDAGLSTNTEADSVLLREWVSGPAVLAHKAVKGFVSHCGGNSLHEALYTGTPTLGIPVAGDQDDVAWRLEASGAGRILALDSLTAASLHEGIVGLLKDPGRLSAVRRLQRLATTYPGVRGAVDWVVAVGHGGQDLIDSLLTPAHTEGVFKAFYLDFVLLTFFAALLTGATWAWLLTRRQWRRTCESLKVAGGKVKAS